jgi:hypothetical protein
MQAPVAGLQRWVGEQSESVAHPAGPLAQLGLAPRTRMHWLAAPSIRTQRSPPQSASLAQVRPQ